MKLMILDGNSIVKYKPVILGVIIMALFSFVMLLIAFRMNKERVKTKPQIPEKGAAKKTIKLLFQNRAFVSVSLISMLLLSGQMFTQSFYTYLFKDYFNASWMVLASQACTYSPMLVMMFLLPGWARKIGKKEVAGLSLPGQGDCGPGGGGLQFQQGHPCFL